MSSHVTTDGTGAFSKFLQYANFVGKLKTGVITSPDLRPDTSLTIDNVPWNYPVTQFSFRPNQDVKTEDTGHGVVRIAWDELENSGNLTLTIEDIPGDELDGFINFLLEVKPYRWLGFRGRRYRTNGFTPSYKPERDRNYYTVTIVCAAYRPHKALPPVPGTEIFPILDIRRYGGKGSDTKILHVGGLESWLAIFHTYGVTAWDTRTGTSFNIEESVTAGGLVSFYGDTAYVVYGTAGRTVMRDFSPTKGFTLNSRQVDVPFSMTTHTLVGDTLFYLDGTSAKQLEYNKNTITTVSALPSGIRINPLVSPKFLYSSTSSSGDLVQNAAVDVLGATLSGEDRAIVFKATGVYLYEATAGEVGFTLGAQLRQLDSATSLTRFGIMGSPGLPEGYWYVEDEQLVWEEYMPVSANVSPAIVTKDNSDDWANNSLLSGTEYSTVEGGLILTGFDAEPYNVYTLPHETINAQTFSGIGTANPEVDYSGEGYAIVQSGVHSISAAGVISGSRFWYEANIPVGSLVKAWVNISSGEWQEVTAAPIEEPGDSGTIYTFIDIPGLPNGTDCTGKTVQFRFELSSTDVATANPTIYYVAWSLSNATTNAGYQDSDNDGVLEAQVVHKKALLRSAYSDVEVKWNNMQGIHFNGYQYFPYTDKNVFQVFPLL